MDIVGDRTLRDLLQEKVSMHREKPFLLFEDEGERGFHLTYGQFEERVTRLGNAFAQLGVGKGDKVTIHLPNCLEFMTAWFAIASIGAVMVPTNILSTAGEMEYILEHSGSVLLITEERYLPKFDQLRGKLPNLRSILLSRYKGGEHADKSLDHHMERASTAPLEVPLNPEDVAAMLYTSGTTSRPKGVLVTHANYLYAGEVMSKSIRLSPEDRQLIVLPLFHGNAQYYSTMSALTVGASVAITERFSASRYAKQAKRLGATVGSLFAAPIRMILAQEYDPADRENRLRVVWFAQSVTREQLALFEERYDTKLLQLYGMTETIGAPLMNPLDGIRNNMGIGRPTLGYEVKVIDPSGMECPRGEVGQLIVKGIPGRSLMKGYFRNREATEETLRDGWLYTGDHARIDESGYFFFVDRAKDMMKRAGENVAAQEIENVIAKHPSVYECAVIGVPDEMRDESIKAYVMLHQGAQATAEEIIAFCTARLAKFKVPEYVEFVEEFPRTSVGKIQKHVLRRWHEERG
ncbi:AMP-binding protein [Brevibacillus humidisoli]|uniref:AMP-binding protein n=1 Tax=Brevibacillus humidisoli TaxID=2895522 RepID=UPI001E3C3658|nr:AMP-binding protein [Brevibacillus humidisoli]UFJ39476.1 AMP-binding protein [Brevibacillus humidisoli]